MLNDNGKKLWALNYAERNNIVNAKTITAIQAGIAEGYSSFSREDCLNRLIGHYEQVISSEGMNYAYSGMCNKELEIKATKNLELLKQIVL